MRINPVSQQNLRVQNDTPAFKAKFKAMSQEVKKVYADAMSRDYESSLKELSQTFKSIYPGKVIEVDIHKSTLVGDTLELHNPETLLRKEFNLYDNYKLHFPQGLCSALRFLTNESTSHDFWHDKSLAEIFVD